MGTRASWSAASVRVEAEARFGHREHSLWRARPPRRLAVGVAGLLVVATIAGCGGAAQAGGARRSSSSATSVPAVVSSTTTAFRQPGPTAATICTARAVEAVARAFAVSPAAVSTHGAIAGSSYPFCAFDVHDPAARRLHLTAEVDTEPSAYAVLERTIIESAQIFPTRTHPAPVHVGRLGLDASWFPEDQELQTTDAVRLVIVTADWQGASQARKIELARAVAREYLGRSRPKLARGPAP